MIEVAFFDFDDTLIVHSYLDGHEPNEGVEDCANIWLGDRYNDETYMAPLVMQLFVLELNRKGIPCYGLTYDANSMAANIKKTILDEKYPKCFKEVIVTATPEKKIEVMKGYCRAFNVPLKNVLFVDDRQPTLDLSRQSGITSTTPQEVLCKDVCAIMKELGFKDESNS